MAVGQGVFRADMQVSLINDGPVTILLIAANSCSQLNRPRFRVVAARRRFTRNRTSSSAMRRYQDDRTGDGKPMVEGILDPNGIEQQLQNGRR